MKKLNLIAIAALLMTLSSCSVIGDIFKAGYYVGIIVVIVILGLVFWIFSMFRGR